MAIKVNIPSGQNAVTISGLYQWDYGQVLEIESIDLGTMIGEVHFACSSMSEAIVVSCNFTNGVGTVTIPDECLEQPSTITAWVYEIAGTQGRTRKAITIPVTARTRPSAGHDIPTEITDQYTQLITNVNETIDKLENGQIAVKKAETATNAASATTAGNASTANRAITADSAKCAISDKNGNIIHETYETKARNKTCFYSVDHTKKLHKGATIYLGEIPADKGVADIVSVGLRGNIVLPTIIDGFDPMGVLSFSGAKVYYDTAATENPFYTTATGHIYSGGTFIASMHVVVYEQNEKLYLRVDDGFYSAYKYQDGGGVTCGVENLPSSAPTNNYGFTLSTVCICFV